MHRLNSDRAVPRSLEPARLCGSLCLRGSPLEASASAGCVAGEGRLELGPRGIVEDRAGGAEESCHCDGVSKQGRFYQLDRYSEGGGEDDYRGRCS
jgi:hypothetical protein